MGVGLSSAPAKDPPEDPSKPGGRFLQFSQQAKGSDGAVKLLSATFVGGKGDEAFSAAAFLPDGTIAAVMNVYDPALAASHKAAVWGRDGANLPPAPPPPDPNRRGPRPADPRASAMLVRFDANLTRVLEARRMPWASAEVRSIIAGPVGIYLVGDIKQDFAALTQGVKLNSMPPAERGGQGSFVARLAPDLSRILWVTSWPNQKVNAYAAGRQLLVEIGRSYLHLDADGRAKPAFDLQSGIGWRVRTEAAVDARDGHLYIGGEYHSGTGLEPYRNPFMHKIDSSGRVVWTAWNWTGPVVGHQWFRLVSDSAVRQVAMSQRGDVLMGGWSDGGNSVFTRHPLDLTRGHGRAGFGSSVWGAGVLSVGYVQRLDTQSLEVKGSVQLTAFLPASNKPNGARIEALTDTADGSVVVLGGTAFGMIETHDAWVESWFAAHQRDPAAAKVKGGPCLWVYDPDLKDLRLATMLPGVQNGSLASQGQRVLVAGAARAIDQSYNANLPPLLSNPVQKDFGGGVTDAYIMLIDVGAVR